MKTVAVIPARLQSKRLPGKVLRPILGKPLIQLVYERVRRAGHVDEVLIATDSEEVEAACREFTSSIFRSQRAHASGTDRVAEVAATLDAELVINVQCDEPMMDPALIDGVIELFDDPEVQMASAATHVHRVEDLVDPNVVKVVWDRAGDAMYFSRAAIPWPYDDPPSGRGPLPDGTFAFKHIGVYAYRKDCLLALADLPRAPVEIIESLEQLRAQENGWKIRILEWDYAGIDVDTEEELNRVRAILEREGEFFVGPAFKDES